MVLVSMLPMRQKPEGTIMAPTYKGCGSNSSCTRQGGIILLLWLASMVSTLLGESDKVDIENAVTRSFSGDRPIDFSKFFLLNTIAFSIPKVLSKP